MTWIALILLLLTASTPLCCAADTTRSEYRPQRQECHDTNTQYYNSSFSVQSLDGQSTTTYCLANVDSVPYTYQKAHVGVLPSTRYSLWATVDNARAGTATHGESACAQRSKSMLSSGENETPLFVVGGANSQFVCQCSDGFFKQHTAADNSQQCVKCPDNLFYPMHTNMQFRCPVNSQLAAVVAPLPSTSKWRPARNGVQRLLGLHAPDAYTVSLTRNTFCDTCTTTLTRCCWKSAVPDRWSFAAALCALRHPTLQPLHRQCCSGGVGLLQNPVSSRLYATLLACR